MVWMWASSYPSQSPASPPRWPVCQHHVRQSPSKLMLRGLSTHASLHQPVPALKPSEVCKGPGSEELGGYRAAAADGRAGQQAGTWAGMGAVPVLEEQASEFPAPSLTEALPMVFSMRPTLRNSQGIYHYGTEVLRQLDPQEPGRSVKQTIRVAL